jgi:hypothetical protein
MVVLFVAFIAGIVLLVFGAMKSSDVYKDALAKAKTEPAVTEALGSPIKDGFLFPAIRTSAAVQAKRTSQFQPPAQKTKRLCMLSRRDR